MAAPRPSRQTKYQRGTKDVTRAATEQSISVLIDARFEMRSRRVVQRPRYTCMNGGRGSENLRKTKRICRHSLRSIAYNVGELLWTCSTLLHNGGAEPTLLDLLFTHLIGYLSVSFP